MLFSFAFFSYKWIRHFAICLLQFFIFKMCFKHTRKKNWFVFFLLSQILQEISYLGHFLVHHHFKHFWDWTLCGTVHFHEKMNDNVTWLSSGLGSLSLFLFSLLFVVAIWGLTFFQEGQSCKAIGIPLASLHLLLILVGCKSALNLVVSVPSTSALSKPPALWPCPKLAASSLLEDNDLDFDNFCFFLPKMTMLTVKFHCLTP